MSVQSIAPGLPSAIGSFLASTRRRLRLQATVLGAAYGLVVGLGVAVALGVATRLQPLLLPDRLFVAALVALAVGTVLGAAFMATRPLPLHAVAAHADRALDLRERLSTALELSEGKTHSTLAGQHLAETAQVVEARRDERIAWPRPSRELTTTLGLLPSGGSDWHGAQAGQRVLGCMHVTAEWLARQDDVIASRRRARLSA